MTTWDGDGGRRRLIVAVTGASGAVYGARTMELLHGLPCVETHLILTAGARRTLAYETSLAPSQLTDLADVVHQENDLAASISSGSFRTDGMIVVPCSIKSLSAIAHSYDDTLVSRAADVVLKERRRLVLVVRESPLHLGHLRLMTQVTEVGGIVAPPVPSFYHHPHSVGDLVDQTIGRVLDLFGLDVEVARRWTGAQDAARNAREHRG